MPTAVRSAALRSRPTALSDGACRPLGPDDEEITLARRVGYVQDIGRVAMPCAIGEHQGPMGSDAWMQVRGLHDPVGELSIRSELF